jgi:pimeloyl-ACP methyl ester carboxylesterase
MTYRDYVELTASEHDPENTATMARRVEAVAVFESFLISAGVSAPDISRMLAARMTAVSGAPAASGDFPLVLIAQGNGQSAHDQAFLAEYLASHGYVVATAPSPTRISGPMKSEDDTPAKAEEQAADLAFAAARIARSGAGGEGRLAVVGHSFGARSALLFAMARPGVKALVSLDGGIGARTGKGMLERSSSFRADAMTPILHFFEKNDPFMAPDFALLDSLGGSHRFLVEAAALHHIHFTSVGAFSGSLRSLASATRAGENERRTYAAVCRTTLSFLDAFVKESGPGPEDWKPSDPDLLRTANRNGSSGAKWISGPQGRLRFDDGGEGGIPVLFVHGNGGNRTQWAAELAHLRPARRAAAFDLRGSGESSPARNGDYSVNGFAEDVAAVADALKLERFVLVGHSFGGAVVAAYAGRHPDRLAGLVFADVAGDLRNVPPQAVDALKRGFEPANYDEFTARWFDGILAKGADATKAAVMKSLRATPREVFAAAALNLYSFDPAAALAPYKGPRLHIASFLADKPSAIHRTFPEIPVRVVPDASHWLMMDRPEEFNRLLDEFLNGLK